MSRSLWFLLIWVGVFILLDLYAYQAVRTAMRDMGPGARRNVAIAYWSVSALVILSIVIYGRINADPSMAAVKAYLAAFFFANLVFKLVVALLMSVDDVRRLVFAIGRMAGMQLGSAALAGLPLSRSQFLSKAALAVAAVPAAGMVYGVLRGGRQYQIRRERVVIPGLPASFEGFRIAQISDVHSGSFFVRTGVQKGIDLVMTQQADMIVFTGDLVNNVAEEIEPYIAMFQKLKAPHGVFSILGNHDYADYVDWSTRGGPEAKRANLRKLMGHHATIGFDLLMDEHRWITRGQDRLALIGIQNWGARANFPKYGNLARAYAGTEDAQARILLSHDPSHWRAQVLPEYPGIDLMLAGHTHGMQFGVDSRVLKWSPVQYVYPEWAGLYAEGGRHLYVNRGFGFIGFPGRLGIWPEITVLELTRGAA